LERMCTRTLSTHANWQPQFREIIASASPSARVVLVGIGHPMRGDDYVGSFIVKALVDRNRVNDVILFDVEDSIEWVILKIAKSNPRHMILIDACEMNLKAGEVSLIRLAEMSYPFFTTHGIPLKLLANKFLPNAETWILAIQPERMEFNGDRTTLSPEVLASASSVSNFIASTLEERPNA